MFSRVSPRVLRARLTTIAWALVASVVAPVLTAQGQETQVDPALQLQLDSQGQLRIQSVPSNRPARGTAAAPTTAQQTPQVSPLARAIHPGDRPRATRLDELTHEGIQLAESAPPHAAAPSVPSAELPNAKVGEMASAVSPTPATTPVAPPTPRAVPRHAASSAASQQPTDSSAEQVDSAASAASAAENAPSAPQNDAASAAEPASAPASAATLLDKAGEVLHNLGPVTAVAVGIGVVVAGAAAVMGVAGAAATAATAAATAAAAGTGVSWLSWILSFIQKFIAKIIANPLEWLFQQILKNRLIKFFKLEHILTPKGLWRTLKAWWRRRRGLDSSPESGR